MLLDYSPKNLSRCGKLTALTQPLPAANAKPTIVYIVHLLLIFSKSPIFPASSACWLFEASDRQHGELAAKIGDLEKVKSKWTMYAMTAMAFIAGTGWLSGHSVNIPQLLKFFGL